MRPPLVLLSAVASVLALAATARGYALDHLLTTDDIGRNKVPHLGTSRILVVPTRVGTATFPPARLAELKRFYAPEGGPGTFRAYWQAVSLGRWDPIPTLAAPVLYTDRCPVPGKTLGGCHLSLEDIALIGNGSVATAVEDILARVRDEQHIDLAELDVNTASGPGADGYLDGVILDSDIVSGVGFPLAALGNEAELAARPGGGGPMVKLGIIALAPPDLHEFGHNLGFVDLYNGPPVNCLMADIDATLSAFSRQQIGWGEVRPVAGTVELDLAPVLDGGPILRVGSSPRYILIENRAGAKHTTLDSSVPGVYVYSIDEDRLPSSPLGFLDVPHQTLYYPNQGPPYLNVNLPVGCDIYAASSSKRCALRDGEERELIHASGERTGATLRVGAAQANGTVHITFRGPAVDGGGGDGPGAMTAGSGCGVGGGGGRGASAVLLAAAVAVMLVRRYAREEPPRSAQSSRRRRRRSADRRGAPSPRPPRPPR